MMFYFYQYCSLFVALTPVVLWNCETIRLQSVHTSFLIILLEHVQTLFPDG